MIYAQKINAGNDVNGNPRAGWWLSDASGSLIGFVDYGSGRGDYSREVTDLGETAAELVWARVPATAWRQARQIGWRADRLATVAGTAVYGAEPDSWRAYDGPIPSQSDTLPSSGGVRITAKQAQARLDKGLTCSVHCYATGRNLDGKVITERRHWLVCRV